METDRNGRVSRFSHEKNYKRSLLQRVEGEKQNEQSFVRVR